MGDCLVVRRNVAITKAKEYEKRQLATHTINFGMVCSYGCKFCMNPSYVFRHPVFKEIDQNAFDLFDKCIEVIDPWTPIRTTKTAYKLDKGDIVLISGLIDPYTTESAKLGLGRKCIEAVLNNSEASVRILTRSMLVLNDLELFERHKDRVSVGISIPGPLNKNHLIKIVEPKCPSIEERINGYKLIHERGISIFGMISPCMPGIINSKSDIRSVLSSLSVFEPEGVWVETISFKNNSIEKCSKELETHGYDKMAMELRLFATKSSYTSYSKYLVSEFTNSARSLGMLDKTKIIVNSDGDGFDVDDTAVIWLKR